jgi:aconitate hydratase
MTLGEEIARRRRVDRTDEIEPGPAGFRIAAAIVADRQTHDEVSFDINPTSRQSREELTHSGAVATLVAAGARLNQAGCLGCIGVGQAP